MTLLQAIILGIVQGTTEFIPVSSSGHLVLIPWLMGWDKPGLIFDTMLHWGTLLAVGTYYRHDLFAIATQVLRDLTKRTPLASPESRLGWLLVLATLPAVLLGYLFKDFFEALFGEPIWVAGFLLVTGAILWFSEGLGRQERSVASMTLTDALVVGLAQAMAITPGISRSGSTISAGLLLGLDRPAAARFSFLMMIPIVFGAGLLKLLDTVEAGVTGESVTLMVVGFIAAAVSGYLCVTFLIRYLAARSVRSFAIYCWLFGSLCLLIALTR